ncbi:hypothetical protein HYT57_00895 [Candidatus Woesearchaeota archaeon]|nr:hypothetical protein [Candidatus Woesearchaeota archaeon]
MPAVSLLVKRELPVQGFSAIGIDESNHGSNPEIYVAVFSRNYRDVLADYHVDEGRVEGNLEKCRKTIPKLNPHLIRYGVIREEDRALIKERKLSSEYLKVAAVSELFNSFNGADFLLVDGSLEDKIVRVVERLISPSIFPRKLILTPRADEIYPLVNRADHIASYLHHLNEKHGFIPCDVVPDVCRVDISLEKVLSS